MRYIQLSEHLETSPYDVIMQFGCGPNFVLNRSKRFKAMIKQQGEKFWFRFWLLFCLKPSCHDLAAIQELWPEMTYYVYLCIHEIFLQESLDQVTKYCLNEVIKPMLSITPESQMNAELRLHTSSVDQMQDIVIRSTGMAFGVALCDIFFKWLEAEEMDENTENYWTVPEQYLDPKFKPRVLEEFIVAEWKNKLSVLLGVDEGQIPWLKRLMAGENSKQSQVQKNKNKCRHDSVHFICHMSEFMKRNRNKRKYAIRTVDELPFAKAIVVKQKKSLSTEDKLKIPRQRFEEKYIITPTTAKKKQKECAYCWTIETSPKMFKKCKRCVDEKWSDPRYYCNQRCQIADWKELHHEEHLQFRNKTAPLPKLSSSTDSKEWKDKNNLCTHEEIKLVSKVDEFSQFTQRNRAVVKGNFPLEIAKEEDVFNMMAIV